ncbi:hypothetical protein BN946_scf184748.g26 [Trametes cinnabarina]|uniref:BIR-domain-containing protein n=1 Tax=Pycnoporus cinnabarinus TaxID=5643 RepID=A0A060SE09_PYCCI|nr:hypothetical protein BN946_scf184748.g26 [Trametes cinnabarina]
MEYFQARLDSFSSFSKSKRTKASSSKQASRWPHPPTWKATPNSLAEAGFYYTPGPEDPDNVTCFMCKKSLGSWEPEDDPFEIHYAKCGSVCAWAALRCQKPRGNGRYDFSDPARHPTSKAMEKARLDTFSLAEWPHDGINGHGANSRALAKAGFVWSAAEPGDDTVICLYCNLSLSGWDADDDPYQEHLKRDKKNKTPCAFLKAYAEQSLSKSTTKRPTSRSASKVSRSASQTNRDTDAEAMDESGDELAAVPSSGTAPSRASSGRASKSRSSRASSAPAKTPGSRRSTRGTGGKTSESRFTASSELEETDVGSESETGSRASKPKRKAATRSKSRVSAIAEEEDEEPIRSAQPEDDLKMQENSQEEEVPAKEKRKRGRPPKNATASKSGPSGKSKAAAPQVSQVDVESEVEAPPPAAAPKKAHTRTRSKAILDSETEGVAPSSSKHTHTRTKSSSKTKVKQEENVEAIPPAPAPKRKGKQKASPAIVDDEDAGDPPPVPPKSKHMGSAVPRPEADNEQDVRMQPDHSPSLHYNAPVRGSHPKGGSPSPHGPRAASKRTPSLSDDAGYATAEPPADPDRMQVDGDRALRPPMEESRAASRDGNKTASRPTASERIGDDGQAKRPSPALHGHAHGSSASTSRASSTRPLGRASSQKLVSQDPLKVIEIDSDAEDDAQIKPKSTGRAASAGVAKKADIKAGKKLQVEVAIPLKARHHHQGDGEDIPMHDAPPTEPVQVTVARSPTPPRVVVKSEVPGTPMSAIHRSAPVSPARPHDDEVEGANDDVDVSAPAVTASASPRTYHPVLARVPLERLTSLTEEEANMTLEQYIRREMEVQYAQFKADAERRIEEFKQRAAEARKLIETS